MRRAGQLLAIAVATVVVCGSVMALYLPGLIRDWKQAMADTRAPAVTHADRGHGRHRQRARPRALPRPAGPVVPRWIAHAVARAAVITAIAVAVLLCLLGVSICLRLRGRRTRRYELYELHLSLHDQSKPQDLEDMVEALANVVRARPEQRAFRGQPFVGVELHHGPADHGPAWTLAVRCEPRVAAAVDGVLAGAYPDVRLGHHHGEAPQPLHAGLPEPGHVLRLRKARPFVYALSPDGDTEASPPIEAIAVQQVALGRPSSVRIHLTPAPLLVERLARRRLERHDERLRGQPVAPSSAARRGPTTLTARELQGAGRTQNRAHFWLELQVAATSRDDAHRIADAVQARRADNRLHRRRMVLRQDRYRGRFPTAYPPLWPSPSLRGLVSSAEVAHLLELPGARLKGVPVRRSSVPRLPAPPEVVRASETTVALPPGSSAGRNPAASPDRTHPDGESPWPRALRTRTSTMCSVATHE